MTASSGTWVHTPLTGTQYRESRMSYSVSRPSASAQQKPLPLFSDSNHSLSGLLAYRPSSRAIAAVVSRSRTHSGKRMCDFFLVNAPHGDNSCPRLADPWLESNFTPLDGASRTARQRDAAAPRAGGLRDRSICRERPVGEGADLRDGLG